MLKKIPMPVFYFVLFYFILFYFILFILFYFFILFLIVVVSNYIGEEKHVGGY